MKKLLIMLVTIVLMCTCSCSNTMNKTLSRNAIVSYTVLLEDNSFHSYRQLLNTDLTEEIVVKGFENIKNVKFTEEGFYCFGEKAARNYLLFVSDTSTYSFLLPKDIIEFREICIYKGLPLFMSVSEKTNHAVFYTVDFSKNKVNTVYETEEIPQKYIVLSDCIIMCENSLSVNLQSGKSEHEYGLIKIFDGALKNVDSGFEPVAFGEDAFLYSKTENDSIKTFCYSLKTHTSEPVDIHYIDTTYSLDEFEPTVYLLSSSEALYCYDNKLYRLDTENLTKTKIKTFNDKCLVYFYAGVAAQ